MRWLTAGAVGLSIAVLVACGGGGQNRSTSEATYPTATATQPKERTPIPAGSVSPQPTAPSVIRFDCGRFQDVCGFVAAVDRIIAERAVNSIPTISDASDYACPAPGATGLGGPFPLCVGAGEGEHRSGYRVSNQSVAGARSLAQMAEEGIFRPRNVGLRDEFGGAENHVFGIGCPKSGTDACATSFVILASGFQEGVPVRLVYLLYSEKRNDGYRIIEWQSVLSPTLDLLANGGAPPPDYPSGADDFLFSLLHS